MCLLTVAAYGSSLSGWFVYEDYVRPEPTSVYRALLRWSMGVTGSEPYPARVLSLAWHLLNGALLWAVARPMLSAHAALCAVGVFLLHPIQTESVAYLSARAELITAMWALLACWVSRRSVMLAGVCAALALTGKEMGVMAWLLVPLWAWWTGQSWSVRARAGWAAVALGLLTVFAAAVGESAFWAVMPWSFYGAQLAALGRMLWLLPDALWNPVALTIDHDWSWITRPMAALALIGAPVLLAAVVWRSRIWAFALGWTLIALAPRLIVPMPDGLHERHMYIPMIALSLALGASLCPKRAA